MFHGNGEWDEDPFHRSQNTPKSSDSNGHVERIIPIQIVGTPSPPSQPPPQPRQAPANGPAATDASVKQKSEEPQDKKYGQQRHNTDTLQVKCQEGDKQRAKSEPPLKWSPSETGNAAPKAEAPNPPGMTQLGGNQSKNKEQKQENGGFRNIPIVVEGRGAVGGGVFKKGQPGAPPTQTPQKNRFQPDHSEPSTTPPPPPKKVTKDTLQIIQEIVEEVHQYEKQVNDLQPTTKMSKDYLYLDEMLTRNLIKLDTIETDGKEDIRLARRDCIKLIQKVISVLEVKVQEGALVPVDAPAPGTNTSEPAVTNVPPIDLALTSTSAVTVTAEAAMEISPTETPKSLSLATDEPMAVEKVLA